MKISEIKTEIKKYGLSPTSQRELSLFSSSSIAVGYVLLINDIIGFSHKAVCCFYNGAWTNYLMNERFIAKKTSNFLEENIKLLNNIFDKLDLLEQKMVKVNIEASKNLKDNSRLGPKMIVDEYAEYMAGIGVYNCFWRYLKFPGKKLLLDKKQIGKISRKREKYAKVYPETEIILKKIVKKIGRREKFDGELLLFLSLFEIKKYVAGELDVSKILKELEKRRKHLFYYYSNTGEEKIISDKKIIEKLSKDLLKVKEKKLLN
jgi:hypothetical protein